MDIIPASVPLPHFSSTRTSSSSVPSCNSILPHPGVKTSGSVPHRSFAPATYLRDKLQAAQNAFPHLDLHLPAGWRNMTDARTQELWEQKSREFGFHNYSKSVLIADEMIRRYDAVSRTDQNGGFDEESAAPPSNTENSVSGEVPERESSFTLPGEGFESDVSPESQASLNVKWTASSMSGFSKNAFTLTLGEPEDGLRHSTPSIYSPSSPSASSTFSIRTSVNDDEEALKHLEITEDGLFVVFPKGRKEDFLLWWERTAWYIETMDNGGRHLPRWCSMMHNAPVWENFIRVADRQTGEPRMICGFCSANLAYPRTTGYGRTWALESHLRSKSCRERRLGAAVHKSVSLSLELSLQLSDLC
jgi:hypothetical protein